MARHRRAPDGPDDGLAPGMAVPGRTVPTGPPGPRWAAPPAVDSQVVGEPASEPFERGWFGQGPPSSADQPAQLPPSPFDQQVRLPSAPLTYPQLGSAPRRGREARQSRPPAGVLSYGTADLRLVRRRTIRGRLTRIMALPLLTVAVLFIVLVAGYTSAYRAATTTTRASDLLVKLDDLVARVQDERALTASVLTGDATVRTSLSTTRAQVDAATKTVDVSSAPSALRAAVAGIDDLASLRARVDANRVTLAAAFDDYTARLATLVAVGVGVEDASDPQLRASVAAARALRDVTESLSQERAYLTSAFAGGGFSTVEYRRFVAIHAGLESAVTRFQQVATATQSATLASTMDTAAARTVSSMESAALDAMGTGVTADPAAWAEATTTVLSDLRSAQAGLGSDIGARAKQLQQSAATALIVLVSLALLIAIGAAILLLAAARSITRPLAALAADALTMATIRLPKAVDQLQAPESEAEPEPPPRVAVPARSSAEIAAVAEALDSAQSTAYELATEQARLRRSTSESLANLGRRNQNLLRRQLGFITQLEREETDPSGLANLFELDHLATRMRRNAESLLVLVGESSPRTWSEALPVADVLRAAISEVEDYRRVSLRRVDDAFVGGAFVAGIAHMVAELIENGLAFSPPDVDVEIQGRLLPGRYLIGITDQGLGMDPADMARANARLRGEESFLSAPTRYLGHYVVGHLARQMGVDVEITPSPVTGVTARVLLPSGVLASRPAVGRYAEGRANGVRPTAAGDLHVPPPLAIDAVAVESLAVEYAATGGRGRGGESAAWATGGPDSKPADAVADTESWSDRPGQSGTGWSTEGGTADLTESRHWHEVGFMADTGLSAHSGPADEAAPDTHETGPSVSAAGGENDTASEVAHGSGDRTRNGLLKRVPRPRRPEPPAEVSEPMSDTSPAEAAAEMRSRLTSLRAGIARGEHDHAVGGADRPPEEPGSTPETGTEAERSSHGG